MYLRENLLSNLVMVIEKGGFLIYQFYLFISSTTPD